MCEVNTHHPNTHNIHVPKLGSPPSNKLLLRCDIGTINHTLPSTIRAVIGTLTCTSMASNSMSDSEYY